MEEPKEETRNEGPGPESTEPEGSLKISLVPADRTKRAIAFLIDWFVSFLLSLVPVIGWLVGAGYMLLRDGFSSGILDRRSLGKKAMGIRPVVIAGSPVTAGVSARRNVIFAVPILLLAIPGVGILLAPIASLLIIVVEVGLVLTDRDGRRYGDRLAGTLVVESED
ncbi:MAG: RDD family protein [Candidatus Eisenbacteria bacterium]